MWIKRAAVQPVPVALVASPPQKNFGTAMRLMGCTNLRAADVSAPIHGWLALQAIRFDCMSGTATRHPIQIPQLEPSLPTGFAGRRRELHAKQRVISKSLHSFRMWKHARASLCARALRARIGFVLAFLRS